jgi:hypothetical protein
MSRRGWRISRTPAASAFQVPATNTFAVSTPSMNEPREDATATLLPNGKVVIAGGSGRSGSLSSTEIYDPATNTFATSTPSMNEPREDAMATLLPNGKVLIAGGEIARQFGHLRCPFEHRDLQPLKHNDPKTSQRAWHGGAKLTAFSGIENAAPPQKPSDRSDRSRGRTQRAIL